MSEIWQNIAQTHSISPHKIKEIRRKISWRGKNKDFFWINILQLHIQKKKKLKNKTCNYQVVPGSSTPVTRETRGTHCLCASMVSSRGIHEVSGGIHWSSIGIGSFSWFWYRVQGNRLNKTCCIDTSPLKLWLKQLRATLLSKSLNPPTPPKKKKKKRNKRI